MKSKTSIIALATLMLMSATSASAQTNGYVREKPRLEQASSSLGMQGTSTPRMQAALEARADMKARVAERGMMGSTTTAAIRLKMYASSTPDKARDRVLEKRTQIESIIAAKKLVITNEMFAKIKERTDRAAEKLTAAVDRLASISETLRTRATELSTEGVEVSATLALLTEADTRLTTLRASISDLAEDAELAAASSTPKSAWKDTQDMFKEAIAEVHAIREILHNAVATLKDAVQAAGLGRGVSDAVSASDDRQRVDTTVNATTTATSSVQ